MKYQVIEDMAIKTMIGTSTITSGTFIRLLPEKAVQLLDMGKIRPIITFEFVTVEDWLGKLTTAERESFEERSAIMEFDGKIERELAEVEAIKLILAERVISGKCDKCVRVNGCIMTPGQRKLCEGPFRK